jgi:hypothetical protein
MGGVMGRGAWRCGAVVLVIALLVPAAAAENAVTQFLAGGR